MKNRLSLLTLIAMMGVMLWTTAVYYPRYKQPGANATLAWDAAGYYWYLPSLFIYDDLAEQRWADSLIRTYRPGPPDITGFGFRSGNGHVILKYPAGMALAESPFFFIAHALARPLGYPADGFSRPYQAAIQFAALLVAFIGLWGFRRLLLYYFRDGIVAFCLFVLVVGTNYLNYSAIDGSIAHCWLATVYILLMLCSRRFYMKPTTASAVAIGGLCGLAALMRPTDIISCLIPVLWGLESVRWQALKERLGFFRRHWLKLLCAAAAAACLMVIQPVYWKLVSGHWLVYSYQDQGFSWLHPHIWDYAFSYRSGWLIYTPVMMLAIAGFIPFLRRGPHRVMVVVLSVVAFYIVSAWDVWWYAGMGGRAMVQYYPVLFVPFAALAEWLAGSRPRALIAAPVVAVLMFVNVWVTWHAHRGSLYDSEGGMSRAYFWRVIGRWSVPAEVQKLKDGPWMYEGTLPAARRLIYAHNLRQGPDSSVLRLDSSHQFSPFYRFAIQPAEGARWLRASAEFHVMEKEWAAWQMTQFVLGLHRKGQLVREGMMRVQRFAEPGERKRLWVDLKLPEVQAGDSVSVHFWHVDSKKPLEIRGLEVWAF